MKVWKIDLLGVMDQKQLIIQELSVLQKKEQQDRNVFKARAYGKVIGELKNYDKPIQTMEDVKEIPGVGEKIRAKIQEILDTGVLKAAEAVKADDSRNITNILLDIYGIGPVKAKTLVNENGVKSVADLRRLVSENPKLLNDKQKLGLKYYEDVKKRIPRSEMEEHEKLLKKAVKSPFHMDIVGSYRRQKEDSGDIDALIGFPGTMKEDEIKEKFQAIVKSMEESGYITDILALGPKKCMAICRLKEGMPFRRLDLLITPPEEYPHAILYFTGSDKFNIKFRKTALERGYTLNEHEMKPVREGVVPPPAMKNEEDIFKFLEIPYVEPHLRA